MNRSRTTTSFYKSPNGAAKTVLDMSSEGGCLMYHFLFSFPRARTAPRQVSECINPDGNHGAVKSLLSWLLAPSSWLLGLFLTPATPSLNCPMTGLLPKISQLELSLNAWLHAKCSPHMFYLDTAKVNIGTPCLGWDLCREEDA